MRWPDRQRPYQFGDPVVDPSEVDELDLVSIMNLERRGLIAIRDWGAEEPEEETISPSNTWADAPHDGVAQRIRNSFSNYWSRRARGEATPNPPAPRRRGRPRKMLKKN